MLMKYEQLLEDDISFEAVLEKPLDDLFWEDMDIRVKGSINNFFVLSIFGEQGTGKSGIAQLIMQRYIPDFQAKNIVFTNNELKEAVERSKEGDSFIKDETPFQYGAGSKIDEQVLHNFVNQLRASGNNFIMINPTRINFAGCHYMIHSLLFDDKKKTVLCGILETTNFRYLGSVTFDLKPLWENKLYRDYKKRKKIFLDKAKSQSQEVTGRRPWSSALNSDSSAN